MVRPMKLCTTGSPSVNLCMMGPKESHRIEQRDVLKSANGFCTTGAGGGQFLERIVMGDETWIHHYKPETKRQSMEQKHPHLPSKQKFRMHPTAGELMLTVFWDSQGLLLEHCRKRGSTVNSSVYSEVLCDKLKPALRSR